MYNREILEYVKSEVKKQKKGPYCMANEMLADAVYSLLKEEFPEVQMVKCGDMQWFLKSDKDKSYMKKKMSADIRKKEQEIKELIEMMQLIQ